MARPGYIDVPKITGYLRGGTPIYGYVEEKDPNYVAPTEQTTNNKEADAFTKLLKETAKTSSNESSSNQGSADIDFGSQKEDTSTNFDLDRFESLLSRLEASKGRQQRQKSVEGRRDIFSQGLASMMSNF